MRTRSLTLTRSTGRASALRKHILGVGEVLHDAIPGKEAALEKVYVTWLEAVPLTKPLPLYPFNAAYLQGVAVVVVEQMETDPEGVKFPHDVSVPGGEALSAAMSMSMADAVQAASAAF